MAQGWVAVDHVLVVPACFYKLYCPLDSTLCQRAAFWIRDLQLYILSVATNCRCHLTLFVQVLSNMTTGFPIIGGLSPMAWGRKWKGHCLAHSGANGNKPGFTSLIWFYSSAKWILRKYLISVYTVNDFEWNSGKSINKPNIPFNGNGIKHSISNRCSVNSFWMKELVCQS